MKVLRVILGILVMFCGMDCIMFPALGATASLWMMVITMLITGIGGIVMYFTSKKLEKQATKAGFRYVGIGVGGLIFGIASAVLAILIMTNHTASQIFSMVIFALVGVFMFVSGIVNIVRAIALSKIKGTGWGFILATGIMLIILGIGGIANIFVNVIAIGTLFGMNMMLMGMALMSTLGDE